MRRLLIVGVAALLIALAVSLGTGASFVGVLLAVLLGAAILGVGWFFLRSFATPVPPPPEPGTLRRIKLTFRCPVCGAEVRMTAADSEDPEPPRHCMEDMELVAPIE
ncbi:MAG: hypothetical protein FJW94_05140 [Actinobacteria bacterium]|nr:hypothetical protein [Actinomycetota bacterium]